MIKNNCLSWSILLNKIDLFFFALASLGCFQKLFRLLGKRMYFLILLWLIALCFHLLINLVIIAKYYCYGRIFKNICLLKLIILNLP
jgi:hypothetical protein